jgi:hypothetical protein
MKTRLTNHCEDGHQRWPAKGDLLFDGELSRLSGDSRQWALVRGVDPDPFRTAQTPPAATWPQSSDVSARSLAVWRRPGTHLAAFSSVEIRPGIPPSSALRCTHLCGPCQGATARQPADLSGPRRSGHQDDQGPAASGSADHRPAAADLRTADQRQEAQRTAHRRPERRRDHHSDAAGCGQVGPAGEWPWPGRTGAPRDAGTPP